MAQLSIPGQNPADLNSSALVTLDGFRALARKDPDLDTSATLVCRDFEGDEVAVSKQQTGDLYDWVASSASVDRDEDTIAPGGWDLRSYKKSPIWLAFHDSRQPEIGVSTEIVVENGKLLSTMRFGPTPMAKSLRQMLDFRIEAKALKDRGAACSVGFIPKEWKFASSESGREWGIDYKRQELLEISVVPVGSNRDAMLRAMKSAGVELGPVADWAEKFRQAASGLVSVDLETAEAIVRALDPSVGMKLFKMQPAEIDSLRVEPVETKAPEPEPAPAKVIEPAPAAEKDQGNAAAKLGTKMDGLVDSIGKLVDTMSAAATKIPEPDPEKAKTPEPEQPDPEEQLTEQRREYEAAVRQYAEEQFISRTGQPLRPDSSEETL